MSEGEHTIDFSTIVKPGSLVVWGQACAEPLELTRQLMEQRHRIGRFAAFAGIGLGDTPSPEHADCIDFVSFCASGNNGRLAAEGKLSILAAHYSQLPSMLKRDVDVLLLQVSGDAGSDRYSLGASCDYLKELIPSARIVVAELNNKAPVTDTMIDASDIDILIPTYYQPASVSLGKPSATDLQVAANVADLIDDGATLQFGLGAIPECVTGCLAARKDLGLHTGVMSDGAMDLILSGSITNARKPFDQGISVAGTLLGTKALLEFAHLNPSISLRPIDQTHDLTRIAALPSFTAVNSAIEVDLSGQANTEEVGGRYVGAIGGAVDFARGAHASSGGLPILALRSVAVTKGGERISRIVPHLSGPASIGRADIGIVVTEHGVADLRGLSLKQRALRLIDIADPEFRDGLQSSFRMLRYGEQVRLQA